MVVYGGGAASLCCFDNPLNGPEPPIPNSSKKSRYHSFFINTCRMDCVEKITPFVETWDPRSREKKNFPHFFFSVSR